MRFAALAVLGVLVATPAAMAQPYGYGYGGPPPSVRNWHRAHRAEEVARERAAVGDYAGAARAHDFAARKRYEARQLRRDGY